MNSVIKQRLEKYLSQKLYENDPNHSDEQISYYIAQCYYEQGKYKRVLSILENSESLDNRYLLAQSYYHLNLLSDAESILIKNTEIDNLSMPSIITIKIAKTIPGYDAGLYLLSTIYCLTQRQESAIPLLKLCLDIDPYSYCAYEKLCELGEEYPISSLFIDKSTNQNDENFTKLCQTISLITYESSKYNINEALKQLSSSSIIISQSQINTGSICYIYGNLYFHQGNYEKSIEWYEKMIKYSPYHLEGCDKLSTSYWHKNNTAELSILTNTLLDYEPLSEISWIVSGNYYSLLKDHVKAVKYLKRAIEINPYSLYSFILLGHEYTYIDDFSMALQSYESALSINPRSYLAWYGIATIYYEQELYSNSLYHYLKASELFPTSITLLSYLATVYQSLEDYESAKNVLSKANEILPNNPQICFQLCELYYNQDNYDEAYRYIQILLKKTYTDPNIYIVAGHICRKLHNIKEALQHYTSALSIDPKDCCGARKFLNLLTTNENSSH